MVKGVIIISELMIYIVSDSLGETGELVVRAAIAQFDTTDYIIKRYSRINNIKSLEMVLNKAEKNNALFIYTFVQEDLRSCMRDFELSNQIKTVDLLGPLMDNLGQGLDMEPCQKSGIIRELDDDYFSRIDAIEFAVKYDDGKDATGFKNADLILLGVSRTSKTPLSMYLANKNIKVANLPLVLGTDPAEEIYEVPAKRVIGLTNSPNKLNEIRRERLKSLGLSDDSNYTNMDKILEELEFADEVMKRIGCPIIDVSNKAIEETADIVLSLLRKNGITFN